MFGLRGRDGLDEEGDVGVEVADFLEVFFVIQGC